MPYQPGLMFEHGLDIPKGWFEPAALDKSALLSGDVSFDVPAGRVVHLNPSGEFEMGVGVTDMAIFLLQASNDYDVANPGMTPSGLFMHQAIGPKGVMSGVVATGSYEVQSTEFDSDQTYTPGDLLTAAADNADADVGGVLTNVGSGDAGDVEQFVDPVCGVVSDGAFRNAHGVNVLGFWPVWLPGAYAQAQ